jgi:hypothetical protein
MNKDDAQSYKTKAQGKETVIQPLDDGLLLEIEDPPTHGRITRNPSSESAKD